MTNHYEVGVARRTNRRPYACWLFASGWRRAIAQDPHLRNGLNIAQGQITHPAVAQALGTDFLDPSALAG
jgi:alanine dehydrogenase